MKGLIRVGEGHYTKLPRVSKEHRQAVQHVLRKMRKITYRLNIRNGGQEGGAA